jgi:hypothetical protein
LVLADAAGVRGDRGPGPQPLPNKVVMWSFPIVRDGLVSVVDVRNGLFVLRYTGPRAFEVSGIRFLEGNSNSLGTRTSAAHRGWRRARLAALTGDEARREGVQPSPWLEADQHRRQSERASATAA